MTHSEIEENIKNSRYVEFDCGPERDFYEDLADLFNLDPKDPLTGRIYAKAWEYGHGAGLLEVMYQYEDLVRVFLG